jgi:hypothetical protein
VCLIRIGGFGHQYSIWRYSDPRPGEHSFHHLPNPHCLLFRGSPAQRVVKVYLPYGIDRMVSAEGIGIYTCRQLTGRLSITLAREIVDHETKLERERKMQLSSAKTKTYTEDLFPRHTRRSRQPQPMRDDYYGAMPKQFSTLIQRSVNRAQHVEIFSFHRGAAPPTALRTTRMLALYLFW